MRTGDTRSLIAVAAVFTAVAGLALAPGAGAVTSNGKNVPLSVGCTGNPGTGGAQVIYGGGSTIVAPGTSASGCSGTIDLAAKLKPKAGSASAAKKKKRKTIKLGSSSFSLKPGETSAVAVKLTAKGRKALRRQRKLKATVQVTTASAVSAPAKLTIKLKRKRKK